MIADIIINIVYGFVLLILSLLSILGTPTLPAGLLTSLDSIGGTLKTVENILPIATILVILVADLAIELAIFSYRAIKWTYTKVPGIN